MNKVILVGKVVTEPKKKNEKAPCEFRVETIEEWRGEKSENAADSKEYHPIAVWGSKGDYCLNQVKKGDLVAVEGVLKHSSFSYDLKDKNGQVVIVDGEAVKVSRPTTEIKVISIRIVKRATPKVSGEDSSTSE